MNGRCPRRSWWKFVVLPNDPVAGVSLDDVLDLRHDMVERRRDKKRPRVGA